MTGSISLGAFARYLSGHVENVIPGLCEAVAELGGTCEGRCLSDGSLER